MKITRLYIEVFIFISLGSFSWNSAAQTRAALSTNLYDVVDGATMNVDASVGVSRHWTVGAGARYNPYSRSNRQRSFSLGAKYWLWYMYTGWWVSGNAVYDEYSSLSNKLQEGDRYGASLMGGYSRMLGKHFNLDIGFGFWGGYETFKVYGCETCAKIVEQGEKYFLSPERIMLSVSYIF